MQQYFWVLESKEVPLYFGFQCGRGHYLTGIDNAVKFYSKQDAENMQKILERLGLKFHHEPMEHGWFSKEKES